MPYRPNLPAGYRPAGRHYRARRPSAWPVAAYTLVVGLFGAFSAARRARDARSAGLGAGRYWTVFIAMLPVNLVVIAMVAVVLIPVYINILDTAQTKSVESTIVTGDGFRVGKATLAAKKARCLPLDQRASDGSRPYHCVVDFADGSRHTVSMVVDAKGQWAKSVVR